MPLEAWYRLVWVHLGIHLSPFGSLKMITSDCTNGIWKLYYYIIDFTQIKQEVQS
jgi:hypothetical protein